MAGDGKRTAGNGKRTAGNGKRTAGGEDGEKPGGRLCRGDVVAMVSLASWPMITNPRANNHALQPLQSIHPSIQSSLRAMFSDQDARELLRLFPPAVAEHDTGPLRDVAPLLLASPDGGLITREHALAEFKKLVGSGPRVQLLATAPTDAGQSLVGSPSRPLRALLGSGSTPLSALWKRAQVWPCSAQTGSMSSQSTAAIPICCRPCFLMLPKTGARCSLRHTSRDDVPWPRLHRRLLPHPRPCPCKRRWSRGDAIRIRETTHGRRRRPCPWTASYSRRLPKRGTSSNTPVFAATEGQCAVSMPCADEAPSNCGRPVQVSGTDFGGHVPSWYIFQEMSEVIQMAGNDSDWVLKQTNDAVTAVPHAFVARQRHVATARLQSGAASHIQLHDLCRESPDLHCAVQEQRDHFAALANVTVIASTAISRTWIDRFVERSTHDLSGKGYFNIKVGAKADNWRRGLFSPQSRSQSTMHSPLTAGQRCSRLLRNPFCMSTQTGESRYLT